MNKVFQISSQDGLIWAWTDSLNKAEYLAPFFTSDPQKHPRIQIISTRTKTLISEYDAINQKWLSIPTITKLSAYKPED